MDIEILKENLNGMYWTKSLDEINIPKLLPQDTLMVWNRLTARVVASTLSTLEKIGVTYEAVKSIENGSILSNMRVDDWKKTDGYLQAFKLLVETVNEGVFVADLKTAQTFHTVLGRYDPEIKDIKDLGQLRNRNVSIFKVDYAPPESHQLKDIAEKGFKFLTSEIHDPKERAFLLFMFMARSQFFININKRTASIMMNGELMKHGYAPFAFIDKAENYDFVPCLASFYETGNADRMIGYFGAVTRTIYVDQKKKSEEKVEVKQKDLER